MELKRNKEGSCPFCHFLELYIESYVLEHNLTSFMLGTCKYNFWLESHVVRSSHDLNFKNSYKSRKLS